MTSVRALDEPSIFDQPCIAHALRLTLLAMFAAALAISAVTLFLKWQLTPQLALAAGASCLVALVLIHSGRTRLAVLLPLLSIAYAVLHSAARSEGIDSIGLSTFPVLIVVSSLVLDRLALVLFTAGTILGVVGMLAIRYFVLRAETYSTNDMGDLFIFALTCATAALVGRLLAMRIAGGFRRIRDSESRYRDIFENVQDVYYEMRADGILLELSPASDALFGVPRERMIGHHLAPFCVNGGEFDALLAALRAQGRVSNRELVIRDSGAALRHVLVNASLQTATKTREERVIGSIRDITERKRAEEALRESERTFRELLEGVQLVAVMTDLSGKISFCNDYTLALTGWSREEVIGRPATVLLGPEPPAQVANGMAIAPAAGRTQPFFEGIILEKNGGRRWIQWSSTLLRDSAGNVAGCAGLGEDVTELRTLRAETARRESEEQFRSMADTAPLMIWTAGPDKLCTFVNKAWLAFTGRALEQELGNGWTASIHPDDFKSCLTAYTAALDARRSVHLEYRKRRADGEYRWVLGSGVPRFGPNGEFVGYMGTCNDITDLRRRQEEDLARQKWESLGTLAGGIAHDFNNLLGGILSQTELALAELAEGAPADTEVRAVQAVAIRGAEIVRQLMAYAGQKEDTIELVNVSRLIEESLQLLGVVVSKHAVLELRLTADVPPVRGNAERLRQILINLATNASEAIGEHDGMIQLSTSRVRIEPDSPGGGELPAGDYLQLEISDTGCGIPPDKQAKIFDPFFTTKSPGRGLGLAVVQGIVRRLGGAITVRSGPRGSTFQILLPGAAVPPAEAREYHADAGERRGSAKGTILIVEDEETLRFAISKMLRKEGFTVLEAAGGSEALEMLGIHAAELTMMLLDVTLPGVASPEILREARRICPDLRIIVTSAYSEQTVATMFSGHAPQLFLRKPFRIADLLNLLS